MVPAILALLGSDAVQYAGQAKAARAADAERWREISASTDVNAPGSSLNAEVNALGRVQIVRGRNSSYFGSKYYVVDNISALMWRRDLCGARLGCA